MALAISTILVGGQTVLLVVPLRYRWVRSIEEVLLFFRWGAPISFLVWVYFAARHLWALRRLEFSPAAAVGWFFVPLVNIYKPFDILSAIVHRSKAGPKHPRCVVLCWGAYIFSRLFLFSARSSSAGPAAVAGLLVLTVALVGMFWTIGSVARAQPRLKPKKRRHPAWIDIGR